jgi:hypothetical protein
MIRARFAVSQEIITPESAEHGEPESADMLGADLPLRDAIDLARETRTSRCDGVVCVECDSMPAVHPRSVRIVNGAEFETGASESRTLHIPPGVSASSARRIARLLGARLN